MLKYEKTKLKTQLNNPERILLSEYASDDNTRIAMLYHHGKYFTSELWDMTNNTREIIQTRFEESAEYECEKFVLNYR